MALNASNFCSVIEDQVCINFDHNIKVHFKIDDSIMVKDYDRNSSISVAGTKVLPNTTRLFSINRDCVKVHRSDSGCLGIAFADEYELSFNKKYPHVVPFVRGEVISLSTDSEVLRFEQILNCEDVFHQQLLLCDDDRMNSTKLLVDNCSFESNDNGRLTFRFTNGLEVNKCPEGHIRAEYEKFNCYIMLSPCGTSVISIGNTKVISSENDFHVVKGTKNVQSINGVIRQYRSN